MDKLQQTYQLKWLQLEPLIPLCMWSRSTHRPNHALLTSVPFLAAHSCHEQQPLSSSFGFLIRGRHPFGNTLNIPSLLSTLCMYSTTTPKYLLFVLPCFLFPGNCISSTFLPHSSYPDISHDRTIILSHLLSKHVHLQSPLMCSFPILSFLVTHRENFCILISVTESRVLMPNLTISPC